ncbi:hypothetical protein B296_00031346 [Ensete ventricosum]|uniref:Uncharacterized protein n=1 Tax=Ensete ventricosum TaxID=4639 RepID=A0A426X2T9_ENSVE|nr:hypothetical protein B296_00031346 [Ensete ventricosum]
MPRPTIPFIAIQAPTPKKLTRDKLREQSTKGLCWHYDEPWSREHHYKKGRLLMIESTEEEDNEISKESLEPEEETMEEESQLADYAMYALAVYSNPRTMIIGGVSLQRSIVWIPLERRTLDLLHLLHLDLEYRDIRSP